MTIDQMKQAQLRLGIRTAITYLAGGLAATQAAKAKACLAALGMSQGDAISSGSEAVLRDRLRILTSNLAENYAAEVLAIASGATSDDPLDANQAAPMGIPATVAIPAPVATAAPVAAPTSREAALALLLQGGVDEPRVAALEGQMATVGKALVTLTDTLRGLDPRMAIQAAIDAVGAEVADIRQSMANAAQQIDTLCNLAQTSPTVRQRVVATVSRAKSPMLAKLNGTYVPGVAQDPYHALLLSPPALGKSYWIRKLGQPYDVMIEHGCSGDSEEANTLKGGATVRGDGTFLIYDGKVTEAVRAAAAGRKTLLFLDEVLRLDKRAQEVILTFLTGKKLDSGARIYEWTTRNTDPSGSSLEVLQCPTENLHIIAAGNLNQAPVEALWSRFRPVRIPYDEAIVTHTAESILADFGIVLNELPRRIGLAVTACRQLVAQGALHYPLSMRDVEGAGCLAHLRGITDERGVGAILAELAYGTCPKWDARTGDIDTQSVGHLKGVQDLVDFTTSI